MPYAIVGYFDEVSDQRIKSLWKAFAENNISDYLHNSENNPHIKFALYLNLELDAAAHSLNRIASKNEFFNLHFKCYGYYPNKNPIIALDIATTMEILTFQQELRNIFDKLGEVFPVNYFDKGIWKPDCQLTTSIDPMEKMKVNKAIEYLSNTELPFDGKLEKIGIIGFHPAKKILTVSLKKN